MLDPRIPPLKGYEVSIVGRDRPSLKINAFSCNQAKSRAWTLLQETSPVDYTDLRVRRLPALVDAGVANVVRYRNLSNVSVGCLVRVGDFVGRVSAAVEGCCLEALYQNQTICFHPQDAIVDFLPEPQQLEALIC